ncbi:MAG: hypothetical protein C0600_07755 [Ignavibacteria bacterium]|nr:MAG: hypothetical protein C0600_07755 [Ignavibacteria bacterium]
MDWYISWVTSQPLTSAAIQFGILGTLGEIISHTLRTKKIGVPNSPLEMLGKMFAWALLGIIIKYGFTMMKGAVVALIDHNLLPAFCASGIGWAFSVSVITNVFFGPQMMYFHRVEDNLILRRWSFEGIETALKTLVWFWIPAHTVTFALPKEFQIGLAALWSVALGIILGLSIKPKGKE